MQMAHYDPFTLPAIEIVAGSSDVVWIDLVEDDGVTPFDAHGCTVDFTISDYATQNKKPIKQIKATEYSGNIDSKGNITGNRILSEIIDGQEIFDTVRIELASSITYDLPGGQYIYQIQIANHIKELTDPKQGILRLYRNIDTKFVKDQNIA